jgi:hypothetical protein
VNGLKAGDELVAELGVPVRLARRSIASSDDACEPYCFSLGITSGILKSAAPDDVEAALVAPWGNKEASGLPVPKPELPLEKRHAAEAAALTGLLALKTAGAGAGAGSAAAAALSPAQSSAEAEAEAAAGAAGMA